MVRHSTSKGVTSTPKSGHEREVPIAEMLLVLLRASSPRTPQALVSTTAHGQPWGESDLLQAFRRTQKKVGLSGFRFHDLRHFFVTALFRSGASALAVQSLVGHLHLATTQKYTHLVRADLRATIGLLAGRGNGVETTVKRPRLKLAETKAMTSTYLAVSRDSETWVTPLNDGERHAGTRWGWKHVGNAICTSTYKLADRAAGAPPPLEILADSGMEDASFTVPVQDRLAAFRLARTAQPAAGADESRRFAKERLREVATLPERVERVAISIDDSVEGPFLVVTRSGHFVTCLGRGMRAGDLPIVTRDSFERTRAFLSHALE